MIYHAKDYHNFNVYDTMIAKTSLFKWESLFTNKKSEKILYVDLKCLKTSPSCLGWHDSNYYQLQLFFNTANKVWKLRKKQE